MSWALVQSAGTTIGSTAANTIAATFTNKPSVGNFILVRVGFNSGANQTLTFSVADNKSGNTYTNGSHQVIENGSSSNYWTVDSWDCVLAATGSSFEITCTISGGSTGYLDLSISEWTFNNAGGAPAFVADASGNDTTTAVATGNLTVSANCLVTAHALTQAGLTWSGVGSGYTSIRTGLGGSGNSLNTNVFYLANTSVSPATPSATLSANGNSGISGVSYQEALGYSVSGPSGGAASTTSSNFTVTPTQEITSDEILITCSAGSVTPGSLTWSDSSAAKTFVFNAPATLGPYTITLTSSNSYGIQGSPLTYTVANTTVYVSNSGSNSNAGTEASPWLTLTYALATAAQPSTINLAGGSTFSENVNLTQGCTIQSYGTGQATIAGASSNNTLAGTNVDGITLSNLAITSADTAATYNCVELLFNDGNAHSNGITIVGCRCTAAAAARGIFIAVRTNTSTLLNNVAITNNYVSGFVIGGIFVNAFSTGIYSISNTNIASNYVTQITGNSTNFGIGIQVGGMTSSAGPNYIQDNEVSEVGANWSGSGSSGPGAMFPEYCDGVVMRGNVNHDIYGPTGFDGVGVDIDLSNINCSMLYNVVYNCDGAGLMFIPGYVSGSVHTIAWNLAINCGRVNEGGLYFGSTGTDTVNAYNNTVIQQTGSQPALQYLPSANVAKLYNNLFITPSSVPSANVNVSGEIPTLQGNAYLSGTSSFLCEYNSNNYSSLAAWRTATSQETSPHGIALTASPLYSIANVPTGATPGALAPCTQYSPASMSSQVYQAGLNLNSLDSLTVLLVDLFGNAVTNSTLPVGAIASPNDAAAPMVMTEGGVTNVFDGGFLA